MLQSCMIGVIGDASLEIDPAPARQAPQKISLRQRECRRLTLQSSRLSREGNGGGKGS